MDSAGAGKQGAAHKQYGVVSCGKRLPDRDRRVVRSGDRRKPFGLAGIGGFYSKRGVKPTFGRADSPNTTVLQHEASMSECRAFSCSRDCGSRSLCGKQFGNDFVAVQL